MDFEGDLQEITRSEFAQEIEINENETQTYSLKGIFDKNYLDIEEGDTAVLVESPRVTLTFTDQAELWERMKKDKGKFKIIHKGIIYKMKNYDDDGEGLVVLYLEK